MNRLISSLILCLIVLAPEALADAGLSNGMRQADRDTQQLINAVQAAFQSQGKWPPAPDAPEMQLCQAIQLFQQQVRRLKQLSDGNQSYATLQAQGNQVLASANTVRAYLGSLVAFPQVSTSWTAVANDMNSLPSLVQAAAYSNGQGEYPYQPNPYRPNPIGGDIAGGIGGGIAGGIISSIFGGGVNPNFGGNSSFSGASNPYTNSLRQLDKDTQSFVAVATRFFQATGRLTGSTAGTDGQFALALQNFQSVIKNSLRSTGNIPGQRQGQVQQLQMAGSGVEQYINELGAPVNVTSAWMQVRNDLGAVSQNVYAGINPVYSQAPAYNQGGFVPGYTQQGYPPTSYAPGYAAQPAPNYNYAGSGYPVPGF